MDDLYQDELLDHYKHPRNFGELSRPTCRIAEQNSTCGDALTLDLSITGEGESAIITDVKFSGIGCAISIAAASKLTGHIKGKTLRELQSIDLDFMQDLIGSVISPGRVKCLTLSAKALMKALNNTLTATPDQ
jgi:nitrogen fixation protein NifU and related proteins